MVLGCAVTAFADDNSGGTNGTGSSEGHVNKHIVSVTLPVIADGATPFAYTMDPERLVNETSAAKYAEGTTFTDDAKTNGVYFETGQNAFDSKSTELKATSLSSADIKLTVDVEVEGKDTDIALVDEAPDLTDESADPELYLELKVDDETEAVSATEKVSIETTIAGKNGNFETTVKNGAYVYEAKTGDSITWNEATIQMSGVVSKSSAEGLTAPTLKVTWKWEDPAATPTDVAPSATATQAVLEEGQTAAIAVNLGAGEKAATGVAEFVSVKYENDWIAAGSATYENGVITITDIASINVILNEEDENARKFTIKFDDSDETTVVVTLTAKE
jgi:hypothetical protein